MAFESIVYAFRVSVFRVLAAFGSGSYDQHRNLVRLRDRMHRGLDHAAEKSRRSTSISYALGTGSSDPRNTRKLRNDVLTRNDELGASDRLARRWPNYLFHLQPVP